MMNDNGEEEGKFCWEWGERELERELEKELD
jgi:hypothetical protein